MALPVGMKALRKRRIQLRNSAEAVNEADDVPTVCLLLFYAAECGLKERILKRRGQQDTSALQPTHDLRALAKELRLPRTVNQRLERLRNCRLHAPTRATVAFADLHQAWRYGAKLHAADEKEAQAALNDLIKWCEQD